MLHHCMKTYTTCTHFQLLFEISKSNYNKQLQNISVKINVDICEISRKHNKGHLKHVHINIMKGDHKNQFYLYIIV